MVTGNNILRTTGRQFVWACADSLQAERANRIGREMAQFYVTDWNFWICSRLPSSGVSFYHGKHILLKIMVDSWGLCDRLRNQVNEMGYFLLENGDDFDIWLLHQNCIGYLKALAHKWRLRTCLLPLIWSSSFQNWHKYCRWWSVHKSKKPLNTGILLILYKFRQFPKKIAEKLALVLTRTRVQKQFLTIILDLR